MRAPILKDWSSVAETWEYCSSGKLILDWNSTVFMDGEKGVCGVCVEGGLLLDWNSTCAHGW